MNPRSAEEPNAVPQTEPQVPSLVLNLAEQLTLQQLRQREFWARSVRGQPGATGLTIAPAIPRPERWELTSGITLHDWQQECVTAWFNNGRRGVLKVVTGAGKTILALAIAERLQSTVPDLRVAIVVPTVVLLDQWYDELTRRGNLPTTMIGRLGGGHDAKFSDEVRVVVATLTTAAKKLPGLVSDAGVTGQLLLIVDECHRAGSAEMRNVFRVGRLASLGLSATPERDDSSAEDVDSDAEAENREGPTDFKDTVLGTELGSVVYELDYAEAIRRGILPPFRVVHHGLPLEGPEVVRYERISREIRELRTELQSGRRRGVELLKWCRSKAAASNPKAARLVGLTSERKQLVYRIRGRSKAVIRLLEEEFRLNPEARAILFHESIDEVMRLFALLLAAGYPVVAEHSGFADEMRAESLRLFREGTAKVIVSARSLIEGFNVPLADVGIIVAASSSVRQRVQTLGRLLRKGRRDDGGEKQAAMHVLYAASTVDEMVYEKADWDTFVGAERNEYFRWDQEEVRVRAPGPPRRPSPEEESILPETLTVGGPYPGRSDDGEQLSVDTQGTVRDEGGRLARPHPGLAAILAASLPAGGRFRVTPVQRYVTRLKKSGEAWGCVYLGRLIEPLDRVPETPESSKPLTDLNLMPGDPFPLERVKGNSFSVLQRDRRLIALKSATGVRFVKSAEQLGNESKAAVLRGVQGHLAKAYAQGRRMNKITVTREGDVVYVIGNEAFFAGKAPEGAEGFVFE
ncbi:MAG: hypothetical protein C0467_21590 [Planctomycetaceae bacterium]|nr:hypothetical protein [Planctomycetaceae bacterium]